MSPSKLLHRQPLSVRWRSFRRPLCVSFDHRYRSWLLDSGSLTARLRQLAKGDLRVEVVSQGWGRPNLSEARVLGIDPRQRVLVREVRLIGRGQAWVHARSLIPATTLTGKYRQLAHLGNRPLGELLFTDPDIQRGTIQTAPIPLYSPQQRCWARRSVFHLAGKPLLVSEVFLPALLQVQ